MNRLIIIGASGHGKVVADIAELNGYTDIVFLDNNPEIKNCAGYPVLGPDSMISQLEGDVFVAIGNAEIRKKIMKKNRDRFFPVLFHPSAVVAESVEIGAGSVIMAGAVVNPEARIGRGVIVNTCSSVDHDCIIGDYCHISVGTHLCGTVNVGECSWIGAGAIVINNINICADCMIGAGAVVINNLEESGIYIGIPAKHKNGGQIK